MPVRELGPGSTAVGRGHTDHSARFCFRSIDSLAERDELRTREARRAFLLDLIRFAACIEGCSYGALGRLLRGSGDEEVAGQVGDMIAGAVEREYQFAEDLLARRRGVRYELADMRARLEHVADRRLELPGIPARYGAADPFASVELQDVQELSNSFE